MKIKIIRTIVVLSLLAKSLLLDVDAANRDSISGTLQPYVDRHELAGAVTLVASKDKILSLEAIGYSDIASKKLMKTDSLFWIASMSKPFVAAAIMMLCDEGKLRLDDPVSKYLPEVSPKLIRVEGAHARLETPLHPITVRDLLSHTSGMIVSSLQASTLDQLPLATSVESYSLEPLKFEPETSWSYSNAGINTAARILEVVAGQKFEDFLQLRFFDPLGMKDTTFWPTEAQLKRLAKSYKPNDARNALEEVPITLLHYPLSDRKSRYAFPGGGLFSTAADVARFCQMMLAGGTFEGKRYLSATAIREMTRNQVNEASRKDVTGISDLDGYGLGLFTNASGSFGHWGAYSTSMRIDRAHGLAMIWLIQQTDFPKSRDVFEDMAVKQFATVVTANLAH